MTNCRIEKRVESFDDDTTIELENALEHSFRNEGNVDVKVDGIPLVAGAAMTLGNSFYPTVNSEVSIQFANGEGTKNILVIINELIKE